MSKKRTRPAVDGFNLAFLDVMACGLGAIILIFMLVDFNSVLPDPTDELARLASDTSAQEQIIASLSQQSIQLDDQIQSAQQRQQQSVSELTTRQQAQQDALEQLAAQQAKLAELEAELAKLGPIPTPDANIAIDGQGGANFLLGLKVEGQHIGILVDHSASMMAAELIEIFRLKAQPESVQQQSTKWQQTLRAVQWLMARLPANSSVTTVAFSEQSSLLGGQSGIVSSDTTALTSIQQDLLALVPRGGTNLEQALEYIQKQAPTLTDLYVITDGLPTQGQTQGLRAGRECASLFGNRNTVSGACREVLFAQAVKASPRIRTHVILLPLEGDPKAAPNYWLWAQANGGTLLAPSRSWP